MTAKKLLILFAAIFVLEIIILIVFGGFSPDAVALVCAHSARKIVRALGLNA